VRWQNSRWLPISLLVVLTVLLFSQALSGPWIMLERELDFLHFRHFEHCREFIEEGTVPLWTPRTFFGTPLLANIQLGLCYPPNWLALTVLPTRGGLAFLVTLHIFLAAAFTYGLARSLGARKAGAFVAAATFAFSGFVVSKTVELMTISALPWLPAVLWAMEAWFRGRRPVHVLLAGGAFGLQCLAGHTQYAYYSALTAAAYGLFHVLRSRGRCRDAAQESLVVLVAVALIGAGLFAVQLLPTYELTRVASRAGLDFEEAAFGTGNVLTFPLLLQTLLPHFARVSYGSGVTLFLGLLWPMLAILGLLFGERRPAAFLGVVALVSLLLAAGGELPFFKLLYYSPLPGFSLFHDPIRIIYVSTLTLALLCGFGIDAIFYDESKGLSRVKRLFLCSCMPILLLCIVLGLNLPEEDPGRHYRVIDVLGGLVGVVVGFCAVVVPLRSPRHRPALIRLLIGMQVLPLLLANMAFLPRARGRAYVDTVAQERELVDRLNIRAQVPSRLVELNLDPLQHARWVRYGVDSASGFSSLVTEQVLEFSSLKEETDFATQQCSYTNFLASIPCLVASNSRYLIVPKEGNMAVMASILGRELQRAASVERPLLRPVPLPPGSPWEAFEIDIRSWRVRAFGEALFAESLNKAFELLLATPFGPPRLVLLGPRPPEGEEKRPIVSPAAGFPVGPVARVASMRPQEIAIDTGRGPGWVFLSEQHFPGWRAFADGRRAPVHRAQRLFKAVRFGADDQKVTFVYEPRSFRTGLALALFACGALACAFSAIATNARRRDLTPANDNGKP